MQTAKADGPAHRRIGFVARPLIEPEWDLVRAFVRRMKHEDLRLRFGQPLDFADDATLRRAFDLKGQSGEIAWMFDDTATIAAIGHCMKVSPSEAELGLIVRSDLQRLGIGEFLLRQMLARSVRQGLETVSAFVLRENRAALRLVAKAGFVPREACALTVELTYQLGGRAMPA